MNSAGQTDQMSRHPFARFWASGWGVRKGIAGLSAVAIVASAFVGVLGVATATEAGAATAPVSLDLASGTFAPQGNPPKTLPAATTPALTGSENTKTGVIAGASLIIPTQPEDNTGTRETIKIYESNPGHAVATINSSGDLTITDTLLFAVDITFPLTEQCVTQSPSHVLLHTTSPYDVGTQDVALAATAFTVAPFSSTNCATAASTVTARFSGSVGNVLTLDLHGPLTVPGPGSTTVTTLTAVPGSPQLGGTSVALTATLSGTTGANQAPIKTTPATTAPTGTMKFFDGTTLLSTQPVTSAATSYTTSALPPGTDQLTAVYSGGNGYEGSTSAAVAYVIAPKPSVTVTPPASSVPTGQATPTPFSLTVANPSTGETWTQVNLAVQLSGIRNLTGSTAQLQYEDSSGGWCTLPGYGGRGTIIGFFLGAGSSCTPTYPASFSLAAGATLTINFRIAYPTATLEGFPYGGTQKVTGTLSTGTCSPTTTTPTTMRCTTVAPLTGTKAPVGSGTFSVLPPTPTASRVQDIATRRVTGSTIRKTFNVPLVSAVKPAATTTTTHTSQPPPSGTVTYAIDGTSVLVATLNVGVSTRSTTIITLSPSHSAHLFDTATLSIGSHTLVSTYSGNQFYAPSTLTETFTVIAPPTGTPFTCSLAGEVVQTLPAYVTAIGTVPSVVLAKTKTIRATDVSVTLDVDPANATGFYNASQTKATLGFSPTGTNATAGPITFTGTTGTPPDIIGTWTGMSTSIPVKPGTALGTSIAIGTDSIGFVGGVADGQGWSCTPTVATTPAPIGATTVAGTALTVNPASPVVVGTPVTLTSTVYPTPVVGAPGGTVQFYDGTTPIGARQPVSANGTATVTVSNLAEGTPELTAAWTGTPTSGVGYNVSNTVSYTVEPAVAPVTPVTPVTPVIPPAPPATGSGYRLVAANGSVYAYGTAPFYGSMGGKTLNQPIVGTASTPGDGGYWLVASDGGIFAFGNAAFYGSMGGKPLNQPIVGIASTPDGKGYWEVASDGGIFAFGDATFYGSMGGKPLNKPIVGIAATPDGKGYWEVASDGGIFAFGDATFAGSTGSLNLNKPIVGMASTNNGQGYWLVAADGGVFSFGNAGFHGTVAGTTSASIVSITPTTDNGGYWETASNGQVFQFGDATSAGTALAQTATIVAMSD
jgi:Big-like domain-containing protein